MEHMDYGALFEQMHPRFFEGEGIRQMQQEQIYEEMILPLAGFDLSAFSPTYSGDVSFGYFDGDREELLRAVERVEEHWPAYFGKEDRVYCGFLDGRLASFCLVEDMGVHVTDGRAIKIGGPGCVGTLPEYRCRGIGLAMVARVTDILKQQGYDYSYIHYTGVAPWYAKLGYETVLKWNRDGILERNSYGSGNFRF